MFIILGRLPLVALLAAIFATSPASAAPVEQMPFKSAGQDLSHCPVTVAFMSFASGIDDAALKKIAAFAGADPGIATAQLYPWGMEGEQTLCLAGKDPAKLFAAIKAMLPATPERGSIELTAGEKSYVVPH